MADTLVPQAVLAEVQNQRVQAAMLLGSFLEGGWGPKFAVGDQGTSFGPYQMHEGGALTSTGLTPQEAENVDLATKAMLPSYQSAVNQVPNTTWQSDPEKAAEQAAVLAERPAQDYYSSQGQQRVDAGWQQTESVLGGNANLTSAQGGGGIGGIVGGAAKGLASGLLGNIFGTGDVKGLFERVGLVIFGAFLIMVGLIILGIPVARQGVGVTREIMGQGQYFGAIDKPGSKQARADKAADVERRQDIANRSIAIGERKVAIQAAKERRLGSKI